MFYKINEIMFKIMGRGMIIYIVDENVMVVFNIFLILLRFNYKRYWFLLI